MFNSVTDCTGSSRKPCYTFTDSSTSRARVLFAGILALAVPLSEIAAKPFEVPIAHCTISSKGTELTYYLPKTRLKISGSVQSTPKLDDDHKTVTWTHELKTLDADWIFVPDLKCSVIYKGSSWTKDRVFSLSLADNGLITGSSTTQTDKVGPFIASLVKVAATVAMVMKVDLPASLTPAERDYMRLKPDFDKLDGVNKNLESVRTTINNYIAKEKLTKDEQGELESLQKREDYLSSKVTALKQGLVKENKFSQELSPDFNTGDFLQIESGEKLGPQTEGDREWLIEVGYIDPASEQPAPETTAAATPADPTARPPAPDPKIRRQPPKKAVVTQRAAVPNKRPNDPIEKDRLYYFEPSLVLGQIKFHKDGLVGDLGAPNDPEIQIKKWLALPEFSALKSVSLDSPLFSTTTIDLQYYPNGALKTIGGTSTGSAAAGILGASQSILDAVSARKTQQATDEQNQSEYAQLKKETDLLELKAKQQDLKAKLGL